MKKAMKMLMEEAAADGREVMAIATAAMRKVRRIMSSFSRVALTMDLWWAEKLMKAAWLTERESFMGELGPADRRC